MKKNPSFLRKNLVFFVVVAILLALELFLFLFYGGGVATVTSFFLKNPPAPTGIILFYSDTCNDCTLVNNFINTNHVADKVAFKELDILNNAANESILADKAQICGISSLQTGVPFLWNGKDCIIGYVDIINFFKQKIAAK